VIAAAHQVWTSLPAERLRHTQPSRQTQKPGKRPAVDPNRRQRNGRSVSSVLRIATCFHEFFSFLAGIAARNYNIISGLAFFNCAASIALIVLALDNLCHARSQD
jgi:hypothetical protein